MNHRLHVALIAATSGLGGLLVGCGTKSDVSLTGNTPAQYSHVWVTVQAVWVNTSGTAGPDDGGWEKFSLSTPSTVDLVAENGGNLGSIASGLRVRAGTYSQVRLIPVDATAPLASSAQNAGALYNFEADYVDSSGTTQQLPLELLNPDQGIGIPTSIKIPIGNVGVGLGHGGTGTSTTTGGLGSTSGTTGNPFGTTTGTTSALTSTTTGSTTSTTPNNSLAAALDGTVNLVPFTFATNSSGILWSAHATAAYDLSIAGGISGQLSLTNITTSTSGLPNIRVSAQTLSADGSRWVVVSSTAVLSDGSFLLYPLATNSSTTSPLTYDVVIHGPDIATIIVKGDIHRPDHDHHDHHPERQHERERQRGVDRDAHAPPRRGEHRADELHRQHIHRPGCAAARGCGGELLPDPGRADRGALCDRVEPDRSLQPGAVLPPGAVAGHRRLRHMVDQRDGHAGERRAPGTCRHLSRRGIIARLQRRQARSQGFFGLTPDIGHGDGRRARAATRVRGHGGIARRRRRCHHPR